MNGFISYKGRPLPEAGESCRVYRCIPRPGLFSIMAMEGRYRGLVLGHCPVIGLRDVKFIIQRSGFQRCQTSGQRNVHALAQGLFKGVSERLTEDFMATCRVVTYMPFSGKDFFFDREEPDIPIWSATDVWTSGASLFSPM